MTAKLDERKFYLSAEPTRHVMACITNWAPAQSVHCYWAPRDLSRLSEPSKYCVVFRQWTRIRPEHRTALELMLAR